MKGIWRTAWPWLVLIVVLTAIGLAYWHALKVKAVAFDAKMTLGDLITLVVGLGAITVPTLLWFRERRDRIAAEAYANRLRDRAGREALMVQALRFHAWVESHTDPARAPLPTYALVLSNTSDAPITGVTVELAGAGDYNPGDNGPDDWPEVEVEVVPPASAEGLMRIDVTERLRHWYTGSDSNDYCMIMEMSFNDAALNMWERDGNHDLKLVLIGGERVNMTTRTQVDLLDSLSTRRKGQAVDLNLPSWMLVRSVAAPRETPPPGSD